MASRILLIEAALREERLERRRNRRRLRNQLNISNIPDLEFQPSTSSQPSITVEISRYPSPMQGPASPAVPVPAMPSRPSPTRSRPSSTRSRPRRRAAAVSDVRSRLFLLEEERVERENVRNAELAGIKDALLQLCGLLREFLGEPNT